MKFTKKEILENNYLIAEFMGIPRVHEDGYEPKYDESWDWMFEVIDTINGMGKEYSFATFKTYVSLTVEKSVNKMYKDFSFAHAEYITATQTSKEAAYKLLVKFVKWHNEHITKTIKV